MHRLWSAGSPPAWGAGKTNKNRLAEIVAPTLVAGGVNDLFYNSTLFRETADGNPNAKLCLYEKMGRPAGGKQFRRDVLAFLRDK